MRQRFTFKRITVNKHNTRVAVLVRVSTAKQETARQISELKEYANAKGYEVVEICQETISGSAENGERHGLARVEQLARDGRIEKVLVHEISRIARKNSVAHQFVEALEDCGTKQLCMFALTFLAKLSGAGSSGRR